MADITYPQRWLSEHKAQTNKVGWIRPTTYEVLKCQKGLTFESIDVQTVFLVIPDAVDCYASIPLNVKFLPRLATELDYDLVISDNTICVLNEETQTLEFQGKPGEVTFKVTMKKGGAVFEKKVNVTKDVQYVQIKEGNAFVQYIEKESTIELIPEDATEDILGMDIWNNKHIQITPMNDEKNSKYKIKCDVLGSFDVRVHTSRKTYKLRIKSVENESMIVESLTVNFKPFYKFNETIYISPTFLPPTATLKDYTITVENNQIAKWNIGQNAIKTNELNGTTKVVIKMVNGAAKFEFDLVVRDTGAVIPVEDINVIVPTTLKHNEEKELSVNVTPSGAVVNDLQITSTENASVRFESGKWYLKGVNVGAATVTATSVENEIEKTYIVNVTPIQVASIAFATIPNEVVVGTEYGFEVVVLPTNASNKAVTITSSENVTVTEVTPGMYKLVPTTEGNGWVKAVANDGSAVETTKNFMVAAAPILVDFIELVLPDEMSNNSFVHITPLVLIEPQDATDKSYTVTAVSGPVEIEENEIVLFGPGEGEAKFKITANDVGKESIELSVNVTNKTRVLDAEFLPFGELLNDGNPITIKMKTTPEDAYTNWTFKTEKVTEEGNFEMSTVNQEGILKCTSPGLIKVIAVDQYSQQEFSMVVKGFDKDVHAEFADVYARSLVELNKPTPLYIITKPEYGRISEFETWTEDSSYYYDPVTNTLGMSSINEQPKMLNINSNDGAINYNGYLSADYGSVIVNPDAFEVEMITDKVFAGNEVEFSVKFKKNGQYILGPNVNTFLIPEIWVDGERQFLNESDCQIYGNPSEDNGRTIYGYTARMFRTFADTVGKDVKISFTHLDSEQYVEIPIEFVDSEQDINSIAVTFANPYINLLETQERYTMWVRTNPIIQLMYSDRNKLNMTSDHGTVNFVDQHGFLAIEYVPEVDYVGEHTITTVLTVTGGAEFTTTTKIKSTNVIKITDITFDNAGDVFLTNNIYDLTPTVVPANATNASRVKVSPNSANWEHVEGNKYKFIGWPYGGGRVSVYYMLDGTQEFDEYLPSKYVKVKEKITNLFSTRYDINELVVGETYDGDRNSFGSKTSPNAVAYAHLILEGDNLNVFNHPDEYGSSTFSPIAEGPFELRVFDKDDPTNVFTFSGTAVVSKNTTLIKPKELTTSYPTEPTPGMPSRYQSDEFKNGFMRNGVNMYDMFTCYPEYPGHRFTITSSDPTVISYEDFVLRSHKNGTATLTVTSVSNAPDFVPMSFEHTVTVDDNHFLITEFYYDHPVRMYAHPFVNKVNKFISTPEGAHPLIDVYPANTKNCSFSTDSTGMLEIKLGTYNTYPNADNTYYYDILRRPDGVKVGQMGGNIIPSQFEKIKFLGIMITGGERDVIVYGEPFNSTPEYIIDIIPNTDKFTAISYNRPDGKFTYNADVSLKGTYVTFTVKTRNELLGIDKEYTTKMYVSA